jgi:hypothetical protein
MVGKETTLPVSGQQRRTADHMIDAVGYLITVAERFDLRQVSTQLRKVHNELSLVVANDTDAGALDTPRQLDGGTCEVNNNLLNED